MLTYRQSINQSTERTYYEVLPPSLWGFIVILDWLIDLIHCRKNCPTGTISGWVQKVTEHRGTVQYGSYLKHTLLRQTGYTAVVHSRGSRSRGWKIPAPCTFAPPVCRRRKWRSSPDIPRRRQCPLPRRWKAPARSNHRPVRPTGAAVPSPSQSPWEGSRAPSSIGDSARATKSTNSIPRRRKRSSPHSWEC